MSLWIVDGGMVELPVVARVEDWEEGSYIEITGSDDCAKWNDVPIRYVAERTCRAIPHDNLNESEGMGDAWEVCSKCGALLAVITDNQPTPNYCPNCGAKVVE